jgi:hypothetical protein
MVQIGTGPGKGLNSPFSFEISLKCEKRLRYLDGIICFNSISTEGTKYSIRQAEYFFFFYRYWKTAGILDVFSRSDYRWLFFLSGHFLYM